MINSLRRRGSIDFDTLFFFGGIALIVLAFVVGSWLDGKNKNEAARIENEKIKLQIQLKENTEPTKVVNVK
jgi:hypothetical protein